MTTNSFSVCSRSQGTLHQRGRFEILSDKIPIAGLSLSALSLWASPSTYEHTYLWVMLITYEFVLLFSKDSSSWSKGAAKALEMLQKSIFQINVVLLNHRILNKQQNIKMLNHNILSSTTVFNIYNNWTSNQHIRMISEDSCDTEDCIFYILKFIEIVVLNWNDISPYMSLRA